MSSGPLFARGGRSKARAGATRAEAAAAASAV